MFPSCYKFSLFSFWFKSIIFTFHFISNIYLVWLVVKLSICCQPRKKALVIPMSWSQAQVGIITNDGWLLKIKTNLVIIRVVIRIHNFIFQKNQWFNIFIILFNWNNQTINPPINFQIFHKYHWFLKWLWPLDFFEFFKNLKIMIFYKFK